MPLAVRDLAGPDRLAERGRGRLGHDARDARAAPARRPSIRPRPGRSPRRCCASCGWSRTRTRSNSLRLAAHAADRVVAQIAAGRLVGRTEADVASEVRDRLPGRGPRDGVVRDRRVRAELPHHRTTRHPSGRSRPASRSSSNSAVRFPATAPTSPGRLGHRRRCRTGPDESFRHLFGVLYGAQAARRGPCVRDLRARRSMRRRARRSRPKATARRSSIGPGTASASRGTRTRTSWPATRAAGVSGWRSRVEPGSTCGRYGARSRTSSYADRTGRSPSTKRRATCTSSRADGEGRYHPPIYAECASEAPRTADDHRTGGVHAPPPGWPPPDRDPAPMSRRHHGGRHRVDRARTARPRRRGLAAGRRRRPAGPPPTPPATDAGPHRAAPPRARPGRPPRRADTCLRPTSRDGRPRAGPPTPVRLPRSQPRPEPPVDGRARPPAPPARARPDQSAAAALTGHGPPASTLHQEPARRSRCTSSAGG